MDNRQKQLFNLVVESYIETAEPVGSKSLVSQGLEWSEATVRNELRALEEAGYLTHPHTSAGRIPTELGWRYYVSELKLESEGIEDRHVKSLEQAATAHEGEARPKSVAKALAEISGATIILAQGSEKIYYTGLYNLFSQPEFKALQMVSDLSAVFDRCEECLDTFYSTITPETKIFVGGEHSFGSAMSVLAFQYGKNVAILLGPLRMSYARNYVLMNKVKELL